MAALHNGHNFLIEEFAIATTPGMKLLKPKSMDKTKIRVLAAGLSGSIKDSPALPYVPLEISYLRDHFITRDLQDESFTFQTLKKEFSKSYYSILHLGTHSTFDNYTNTSFIMGFDGKISSDQLQQIIGSSKYRDKPLELITLSACETASGSNYAALGLAGLAIKAGARSSLGTLWLINDKTASDLVGKFYLELKTSSKARALQTAQRFIIQDHEYRHPYYWAAFLLIGNWL